jgi:3-dehydrosphinganine reductase
MQIAVDVATPNYAKAVLDAARAWNDGRAPDIVWCIAGTSTPDLWIETEMSTIRNQMDINFWGAAEMAHAILSEWTRPDVKVTDEPKHIVFTSSTLAFVPILGYGPYTPAKTALKGLADTLVQELELYPQPVKIHIVYPGNIDSPGFKRENMTKPEITQIFEAGDPVISCDDTAVKCIEGLERGRYQTCVAWLGNLMRWSSLGGAPRENWFADAFMGSVVQVVWFFVLYDFGSKIAKFKREHGHPSTYRRKAPAAAAAA